VIEFLGSGEDFERRADGGGRFLVLCEMLVPSFFGIDLFRLSSLGIRFLRT